ncbi:MAG TPA: lipid-A-disaccharide synthase N-terminal domain-containing protein [Rhizomicrobium sp.]|jgi:lipid-A-disaccharide synthase-like uncharacterized protein|nr:lipid-A-disaccharide synthase N-terminal domain-containing protein [Rhizomicrobium sp.]
MNYLTHLFMAQNGVIWAGIGFLGQAVFGVRFLIQWLRSEQAGHSVVPIAFWYVSVAGGLISLCYAIHLQAWPLVLGQALPLPIYLRNVYMILRDRGRQSEPAA